MNQEASRRLRVGERVTGAEIAKFLSVGKSRRLIGIDGPGASGKSTLARQLAAQAELASLVEGDDFYRLSTDPDRSESQVGGLFDLPRLKKQVVDPFVDTDDVAYQRYDWDNDAMGGWVEVSSQHSIVVEGVYSTHPMLRDSYDLRVWVSADRTDRLSRGIERDGEQARPMWEDVWMPAEDEYMKKHSPDSAAHLVLDGSGKSDDGSFAVLGGSLTE